MTHEETALKSIVELFAKHFSRWGIQLPEEGLRALKPGAIHQQGWLIQYRFDSDDNGLFLDYYSSHRMTDDRHVRIRSDGSSEELPSIVSMHRTSDDPIEAKRLEEEYFSRNQAT